MRNNETGEVELVVGTRRLLSAFFILVVLGAVLFAMGYVLGQNSRQPGQVASGAPVTPIPADSRPQPASALAAPPAAATPVEPAQTTPAADTAAPPPAEAPPQPVTQPARETEPPPAPPVREPVREPARPAPQPAPLTVTGGEAAPGAYWQVIATASPQTAQSYLQTLKDKGLPVSLSPGPNNLTRVLVGPYSDAASMGRAKTELEGIGFTHLGTFRK